MNIRNYGEQQTYGYLKKSEDIISEVNPNEPFKISSYLT
jgi:hypothetical protein